MESYTVYTIAKNVTYPNINSQGHWLIRGNTIYYQSIFYWSLKQLKN